MAKHPYSPDSDEVAAYRKYAEGVARRAGGADDPAIRLRRLFSIPLIEHAWMVGVKNADTGHIRDRHYAIEPPIKKGLFVVFSSVIDTNLKTLSRTLPTGVFDACELSPQSKMAEKFKPLLSEGASQRLWEASMIDLVDTILSQPNIDPILQVILLKTVVSAAGEGSEPLRSSLEVLKQQLDRANVNLNVNWLDSQAPQLHKAQDEASRLVQSVRGLAPSPKQVLNLRDKIEQSVLKSFRPVGWLARGAAGFKLRHAATIPREGDLLVAAPLSTRRGEWKKIGVINGGKPQIDVRASSALAEGRPVFVVLKTSP
jgi:hypothetical protein